MILLSGVTGHLGGATLEHLLKRVPSDEVAVLVRSRDRAQSFEARGIDVRIADYDNRASLRTAFTGIDTFFFVSSTSANRGEQQRGVVEEIERSGISRVVYTGLAIRDITSSFTRYLMQSHFETEAAIEATGIPYTFLRNTMYAEAIPQIIGPISTHTQLRLAGGSGKVPYALRDELAEAAAAVLSGVRPEREILNLTGATALGYADIAKAIAAKNDRPFTYEELTSTQYRQALSSSGLPEFMQMLTLNTVADIAEGQYQVTSSDLGRLLGRSPASAGAIFKQILNQVR